MSDGNRLQDYIIFKKHPILLTLLLINIRFPYPYYARLVSNELGRHSLRVVSSMEISSNPQS